jgi:hypothetical protein
LLQGVLEKLDLSVKQGVFRRRVELTNPLLRSFMRLPEGQEAHHDVQVSSLCQGNETGACHDLIVILYCFEAASYVPTSFSWHADDSIRETVILNLQVTETMEPITFQAVYIISQACASVC